MYPRLVLFIFSLVAVTACNDGRHTADRIAVERFDRDVLSYTSLDSVARDSFRLHYAEAVRLLTGHDAFEADSSLRAYTGSKAVEMFTPDIDSLLPPLDATEETLSEIYAGFRRYLPSLPLPRLIGIVSTYNQSVIAVDTTLLIGLNHYLGSEYAAYSVFPPYQRAVKELSQLPYNIAEAIMATDRPYHAPQESTALSRMIYEGSLVYLMMKVIPDASLGKTLGNGDEESVLILQKKEGDLWRLMIERDAIFSTDPVIADRLVRPAPATSVLGGETPARAGRYFGYRIVDSYMRRHNDTRPEYLLTPDFYQSPSVLVESGYTPR